MATDPMFETYARKAPLDDLRFVMRGVMTTVATYQVSDDTLQRVREMVALERELATTFERTGNVKSAKARVLRLITNYKGSIPGYAGACGAKGGWVNEDREYFRLARRSRGPVTPAFWNAWITRANKRAEQKNGYRIPLRAVALTADEVRALVHVDTSTSVETPKPEARSPKRAAARVAAVAPAHSAIACPACTSGRLGADLACSACGTAYTLLPRGFFNRTDNTPAVAASRPTKAPKPRKVLTGGRAAVDWVAAGRKAHETRMRRLAEKQAAAGAAA